jgi:hypothetical protein
MYDALGAVAERHLGPSNDMRWTLDSDELRALLVEAGFTDVKVDTVSLTEHYSEFPVRLSAMAANHDLSALDQEERERRWAAVESDSAEVLARFARDGGFTTTSATNVAVARVS